MSAPAESAKPLSDAARRVQEALRARGFAHEVIELAVAVRTAKDAADAVGCEVAQIVKSLVFKGETSGRGVLVETCGANRVDVAKVAAAVGEPVVMADPRFVRETTGFAIGGIPPLGHATGMVTLIDRDLMTLSGLWAAAGHPNSLFRLEPAELVAMTGGRVTEVA